MVKKALKELIVQYSVEKVEKHLFSTFIDEQNLSLQSCEVLVEYFAGFNQEIEIIEKVKRLNIRTFKDLQNLLELLIPIETKKLNGAFFTPDFIVDFIINELEPKSSDETLDPSCGCGAFLIGLVDYYRNRFNKSIKSTIKENIFGADILEYNSIRTKVALSIYALMYGEVLENSDFNLITVDSLKYNWNKQFDNIIGNPPYIKFQDLDEITRSSLLYSYKSISNGTYNLYFAFIELGYLLLKENGKLGYITPNNYFTSLAGESLRKFIKSEKCIYKIIDFNHKKVFEAQTYTALTFINKNKNEHILYDRIKGNNPILFLNELKFSVNSYKTLSSKKWRLVQTEDQHNIEIIETIGIPIGKLYDINVGVATLKDSLYSFRVNEQDEHFYIINTAHGDFKVEKEVTKPLIKISEMKKQSDVTNNFKRIIVPYRLTNVGATPILEHEFQLKYPECYKYFVSIKDELRKRDKGKIEYSPFYAWGRTQGLTRSGKKLITPTFSKTPRFLIVEDESYFTNGYGIFYKNRDEDVSLFPDDNEPITNESCIDVLQKILNSIVMEYYINKTSVAIEGGYPCYQKNFIEKFSIPYLNMEDIIEIRNKKTKKEIDVFLINKYGLDITV